MVDVLDELVESALQVAPDHGLEPYELFDLFLCDGLWNSSLNLG